MSLESLPQTQRRVLVVEDDQSLLDFIGELLRERGHAVDMARTSHDALNLARLHRYDLLILDLILPDADGVILHGKLKSIIPEIERRTIFMTGFSSETPVVEYLRSISAEFLQKPFRTGQLLDAVTRLS